MSEATLRKCIDAYCKSCLYDAKVKASWRQQISDCTMQQCALFPVRIVVENVNEDRLEGVPSTPRQPVAKPASKRKPRKLPKRRGQKKAAVPKKG